MGTAGVPQAPATTATLFFLLRPACPVVAAVAVLVELVVRTALLRCCAVFYVPGRVRGRRIVVVRTSSDSSVRAMLTSACSPSRPIERGCRCA